MVWWELIGTTWLRPRPAGAPEASLSAGTCLRLPQASASLGHSATWAVLAGHTSPALDMTCHPRPRYPWRHSCLLRVRIWGASQSRPTGTRPADRPRLAGACGSLRHALALREASGAPAGRGLSQVVPISSRPTKPNPVSPVPTGLAYSHTFHVLGILLLPLNPRPGVKAEAQPPPRSTWSAPT